MAAMTTFFISDLHLDAERPAITELFGRFIDEEARGADALYILGDLFEAWVGDDDPSEAGAFVADECGAGEAGVPVSFIRGNRDFLLGDDYARRAGMAILPDPAVVVLYGKPTLLMHGDPLCTDDVAYQQFRAQTRNPAWQAQFLSQPLAARLAFAQQARAASKAHQAGLQDRADGNDHRCRPGRRSTHVRALRHRHADPRPHPSPGVHDSTSMDGARQRIVLGDWYDQGSVLRVDNAGATSLEPIG